MAELWFIRHFRTSWNSLGRLQGHRDIPLDTSFSANNEELAMRNRLVLSEIPFTQVWVSPLERARQTAALHGYPSAHIDPDLIEIDFGHWEGRTWDELDEAFPGAWENEIHALPLGESFEDFAARIKAVYRRAQEASGHILIFGHGAWFGGLKMLLEGRTTGGMSKHVLKNGELVRLQSGQSGRH